MAFHQGFGQRQTQPRAFHIARERRSDLAEWLQRRLDELRRDADARIGHRKLKAALVAALDADAHRATRRGEFDGIGEEVEQNLLHPQAVRVQWGNTTIPTLGEAKAGL